MKNLTDISEEQKAGCQEGILEGWMYGGMEVWRFKEERRTECQEGKPFNNSSSIDEISQQPLTETNHSTVQPFNHSTDNGYTSKKAFTLAEVLITLAVVGVVAVMTLPSVIQKQHEKETVAKVKKAYSVLSQAYLMARNEYGTFDQWGITTDMSNKESHVIFGNNMKKFMRLSRDCVGMSNTDTDKFCPIKDGSANVNQFSRVVLNNGSLIAFRMFKNNCSSGYATSGKYDTCGIIILYTNPNQKTQSGKNAFVFFRTKDAIVPEGTQNGAHQFNKACNKTIERPYPGYSGGNMYACTAWVIFNENMDYWHCDDLDWGGKTKCK